MAVLAIIVGVIGGIGAMFFLDPDTGKRRRALLRDQFARFRHRAPDALDNLSKHARDKAQGVVAETKRHFTDQSAPDEVLVARVRSEMGRYVSHPGAVTVTANGGAVTLSGAILAREAPSFVAAAMRLPGVEQLHDYLERYESADNIPDLQGGKTRTEML